MPLPKAFKYPALTLAALLCVSAACTVAPRSRSSTAAPANANVSTTSTPTEPQDFDGYMRAEFAPADGFDFPFGDGAGGGSYTDLATGKSYGGWYVATHFAEQYSLGLHTGEDWNGAGGGNTDLGQPVYSVANGRVVFARNCGRLWGNVVVIEHLFYENDERREIRSLYAHLNEIKVSEGAEVRRRQLIATVGQDPEKLFNAHLHVELRLDPTLAPTFWPSSEGKDAAWLREHYEEPSGFIKSHRKLPVPQNESTLVLVDQARYKARLYAGGRVAGEYNVSLGQGVGEKQVEGDNRTPKGMYFVVQKHRGDFPGDYGAFYGGHWIKLNYPNRYDAARGCAAGLITPAQEASISAAWEKRSPTLETTRLGGGIGFHGWAREWSDSGPRHLSWGCVVLHLSDIPTFYDQLPEGSMVVIF
ncbi:MAG: peptidoglycan DD-metalloendopeptidase family protein [Acidobacteria bacterium]|nr:peptidoglycan DD-metalloendopeptidase family protein [Acidobacteriota bacterium]MBV9927167.1 peptidoglycan DD-metalloendopeptidase family protein [Acidobacteriota bacterium]